MFQGYLGETNPCEFLTFQAKTKNLDWIRFRLRGFNDILEVKIMTNYEVGQLEKGPGAWTVNGIDLRTFKILHYEQRYFF